MASGKVDKPRFWFEHDLMREVDTVRFEYGDRGLDRVSFFAGGKAISTVRQDGGTYGPQMQVSGDVEDLIIALVVSFTGKQFAWKDSNGMGIWTAVN